MWAAHPLSAAVCMNDVTQQLQLVEMKTLQISQCIELPSMDLLTTISLCGRSVQTLKPVSPAESYLTSCINQA